MKEKARLWSDCLKLRLCLFWVKITSGNAFPEMRLFGWFGKFYFPEIEIRWPKKKSLWPRKSFYTSIIPSKYFRKMRERERACARDRDLQSAPIAISPANIPVAVDRDLAKIAIDSAISPSIAISRRRRGHRTVFSVVVDDFFLGCGLCFSEFVFSFFFSKHQKIFSGKFFKI